MRILFDHQTFSQQLYGGISRYFCELVTGINNTDLNQAHLSLLWSNNKHLHEYGIPALTYPFPKRNRLLQKSNQLYNYAEAKIRSYDIYHATYFDDFLTGSIGSKPFVTTFYDMTYERLSNQFVELSQDTLITQQKRKISTKATHLIAISESTKNDMVEILGVAPERITVIYLGSSLVTHESDAPIAYAATGKPYVLYVGNRSAYKNFSGFLKASAHVLKKYQLSLICAGGGAFDQSEVNLITTLSLTDRVKQVAIDDTILPLLYRGATAFVFPSFYEGFGIPVLEAFSCNCPCIVSNNSSLPEIAGQAALYINPSDHESIVDALERIINNSELRENLIRRGKERLLEFSWQKTIDQTLNLYKHVLYAQ